LKVTQHGEWLAHLADPGGTNQRFKPAPYEGDAPSLVGELLTLAARHNVRPALLRNLERKLAAAPETVVGATGEARSRSTAQITEIIGNERLMDFARSVLLADAASEIMTRTKSADLPAVVVKGPDFAEHGYGGLEFRTFSDVDILVRPDSEEAVGAILLDLGYRAIEPKAGRLAFTERSFVRREEFGGTIHVEVHTDVVHAPELRNAQTLTWELYASPDMGGVTGASRIVLAGLHGATSHLFGRLQYVVDGLVLVRAGVDADELEERAKRSNAVLAVKTMLRLASEIFDSPESGVLAARLRPAHGAAWEHRLISASMVLGAKNADRWRLLPQRYVYRALLRAKS
jgi:putative nucleotidyltransferase-like protein